MHILITNDGRSAIVSRSSRCGSLYKGFGVDLLTVTFICTVPCGYSMNEYNGWTNRETWLVGLWYNPETIEDVEYLEQTLESDFYEMVGGESNIYTDMINFNVINWEEIKDWIKKELQVEDNEDLIKESFGEMGL